MRLKYRVDLIEEFHTIINLWMEPASSQYYAQQRYERTQKFEQILEGLQCWVERVDPWEE